MFTGFCSATRRRTGARGLQEAQRGTGVALNISCHVTPCLGDFRQAKTLPSRNVLIGQDRIEIDVKGGLRLRRGRIAVVGKLNNMIRHVARPLVYGLTACRLSFDPLVGSAMTASLGENSYG